MPFVDAMRRTPRQSTLQKASKYLLNCGSYQGRDSFDYLVAPPHGRRSANNKPRDYSDHCALIIVEVITSIPPNNQEGCGPPAATIPGLKKINSTANVTIVYTTETAKW